jgi:hypothetical protein
LSVLVSQSSASDGHQDHNQNQENILGGNLKVQVICSPVKKAKLTGHV